MNITNVEHAAIAAILTFLGYLLGSVEVGAAYAIGVFGGREHSQREYKLGGAGRGLVESLKALDIWRWGKDAILDLAFPTAAALALVFLLV